MYRGGLGSKVSALHVQRALSRGSEMTWPHLHHNVDARLVLGSTTSWREGHRAELRLSVSWRRLRSLNPTAIPEHIVCEVTTS